MTRKKGNEFFKVMAIAILCIGVFSAGFIGISNMAFASTASGTESIPLTQTAVNIPAENTQAEGFQSPALTVLEHPELNNHANNTVPADAISMEDVAQIAAQYIWDMYGKSIDGMYVQVLYGAWSSHTRVFWMVEVAETKEAFEDFNSMFSITLDAVTGERISISYLGATSMCDEVIAILRSDIDLMIALRMGSTEAPEQLDNLTQLVREHATRHFINTEVVNVEFVLERSGGIAEAVLDENGDVIVTARQVMFTVTDSAGRIADVTITEETGQLLRLCIIDNFFVPGFSYDAPGR